MIRNYAINQLDFSFTMNNPINSNDVIKYLVSNGIYCCSQCPENISFLLEIFPIEIINSCFSKIESFKLSPTLPKVQLIELIVKNYFQQGINTYSKLDMNKLMSLFCSVRNDPNISRTDLSKLIRSSKEMIYYDRGCYIHINHLQQLCYQNKKTVSDLLAVLYSQLFVKEILT